MYSIQRRRKLDALETCDETSNIADEDMLPKQSGSNRLVLYDRLMQACVYVHDVCPTIKRTDTPINYSRTDSSVIKFSHPKPYG